MKKWFLLVVLLLCLSAAAAHAYEVIRQSEDSSAIYYTISCDDKEVQIKFLKSNGGWYLTGMFASNFNYGSMDAAARAACKNAR
ncbi:MAG: hypothetical protein KKC30_13625 [Proteobacteria bacterium]|nr:hypothetical protein [Pseudomonadota bacterium]MBU4277775.1 hypothetical protein [Pseudomonadota bacterium]MBU4385181.1 hypothetical protein [Pseudomonadota bacterium]MBU4606799.1 hypothetical protein [Pseudomonadota bacterium]MCG2764788.1 hypothetical protein [Desulfarculaceae bacterium]